MILFVISFLLIINLLLSKLIFKVWFNQLSIYAVIWFGMIFMYELRLMQYSEISNFTWIIILLAFLSFVFGSITIHFARNSIGKDNVNFSNLKNDESLLYILNSKKLPYLILFFSIIGLIGGIQHWLVLLKMYGSIPAVFLNFNEIYRMRVEGQLHGILPYISSINYVAVFLAAVYGTRNKRFLIIVLLPFLSVLIKEVANVGRAGMLLSLFLFLSAYVLTNYSLKFYNISEQYHTKKKTWFGVAIVFIIILAGATLVRSFRGTTESFNASTHSLSSMEKGYFITPSLYLYMSGHIVVLDKYFENDYENTNKTKFGEITFSPIYNLLAKVGFVEKVSYYDKGYFIPMWANTATYLRYVHNDYGNVGLFVFPYILGLITSFYWYKLLEKSNFSHLVILSYLFTVIMFSFLTIVSRLGEWFISLFILLLFSVILKLRFNKKSHKSEINYESYIYY